MGLLAVVVVALVVLGVYSFASPAAQEAGSTGTTPTTTAPSVAPTSGPLPPLSVTPLPPVEEAPATPVRVPVTVLNATQVGGLAADVAGSLAGQGWPTAGVGEYQGSEVATTTVFFSEGDEAQRQSAVQLMDAFPQVTVGPSLRFFEVPGVADPGLVVVVTGEWQP
ncbi:LytR cell envelope-related transcriptional attenuator [Geodermatophilus telluris]|uniref:LytR cell envelope-related transcriptional attenuator n=1 Tax=Geodermatophilus telluris TaxID=1190417 RepID=A0A1G6LQV9_9ACTN|nr:LytR cell envelope-related transcriptional attenuator [Geodermatophilus telluris]